MSRYDHVGSHATTISKSLDGVTTVTYHETPIVTFSVEKIVLRCGKFLGPDNKMKSGKTSTTKTRMNQVATVYKLPYWVYQEKNKWYIRLEFDMGTYNVPFSDGMEILLDETGSVKFAGTREELERT